MLYGQLLWRLVLLGSSVGCHLLGELPRPRRPPGFVMSPIRLLALDGLGATLLFTALVALRALGCFRS